MKSHPTRMSLSSESAGKRRKWLLLAAIAIMTLSSTRLVDAQGALYFVNTTSDTVVAGACANGLANCSLRGAILASNSHVGDDGIDINLPAGSVINLTVALPDLTDSVEITGPGANLVTVRRDMGGDYRIFNLTTTGSVTFSGFTISDGLGGINNNNAATVNVTNCTLSGNSTASGLGGGIYNNSTGTVTVTNSTLSGNTAGDGGGIYNNSTGTVTVTNSTLSGNGGYGGGGGIFNNGTGTVNVTNCTIIDNTAQYAGGIQNRTGTTNVTNCTLSGNIAFSSNIGGGAIGNNGTLTVTNSTLSGNAAHGPPDVFDLGVGGGISNGVGTVDVTNCTINGNNAAFGTGGGISNGVGTVNVTNSTLSGNTAGDGGGIFSNNGTVNVTNSTLSGNTAGDGGGIWKSSSGTANVRSSIIALNTATNSGPDVHIDGNANLHSQGFNLIGKNDGSETAFPAGNPNANNDIVGTSGSQIDPKFDPNGVQNNGGPTQTIALLSASPAIDKGTSSGLTGTLTTDQRGVGYSRTIDKPVANAAGGDGTDIGAFEFGAKISAISRKTHGAAGAFDINLPLTGPKVGIECRKGGASGAFKVILTFPSAVTVGSASATPDPNATGATGSVSSFSVNGSKVTVNLTNVSNAQIILINLLGVSDGTNTNAVSVPMGVLLGDTTGNGAVKSADVTLTQSKVGQTVDASNFREDVTISGSIDNKDVNLVTSHKGTALP